MTSRKNLFGIFLLLSMVLVWLVYAKHSKDAAEWERKLLAVSLNLELRQTELEVEHILTERWPENLHHTGRVWTPHPWTAHNLNLLVDYKNGRVAALAIRSDDSYQRLPVGAPEDRVMEGFTPYWSVEY